MRFKIRINGGDTHFRIDCIVYCDTTEGVERMRKFARRNGYQFKVELLEDG